MLQKKYLLPIMLLVQILVLQIISFFPGIVENYYSNGIYLGISNFSRIVLGWIPFSVGDIAYFIIIFWGLHWFWKKRKTWRSHWKDNLLHTLSVLSIACFLFHLLWAMNYHRVRLFDNMAIATDYSDADLLKFTTRLIAKTNQLQLQITKSKDAKVVFPYSQEIIFDKNLEGYELLARQYPFFEYKHPSIKKSIMSLPLTYMGFAGYLNPFTNESQVNYKLPMYTFPTVAAHEMAHQLGYASESEANFIGYMASIKNEDAYMQYSGYVTALRYCLANWDVRNQKVLTDLLKTVNPGILKNFKESDDFWESYESFIEIGFKWFYDNFLKLNQQEDGLDSYSKFVDLLVNYYRDRVL